MRTSRRHVRRRGRCRRSTRRLLSSAAPSRGRPSRRAERRRLRTSRGPLPALRRPVVEAGPWRGLPGRSTSGDRPRRCPERACVPQQLRPPPMRPPPWSVVSSRLRRRARPERSRPRKRRPQVRTGRRPGRRPTRMSAAQRGPVRRSTRLRPWLSRRSTRPPARLVPQPPSGGRSRHHLGVKAVSVLRRPERDRDPLPRPPERPTTPRPLPCRDAESPGLRSVARPTGTAAPCADPIVRYASHADLSRRPRFPGRSRRCRDWASLR